MNGKIVLSILAYLLLFHAFGWAQRAEHLPPEVNSAYEEREPIPDHDGHTLYFWRRSTPGNTDGVRDPGDIWYSTFDSTNTWTQAVRMSLPLNSKGHDFIWQTTPSGDTLWVNKVFNERGRKDAGVSMSVRDANGFWTKPRKGMHITNYKQKGSFKDYYLTSEGHLIIPNEGENSFGSTDLYICFRINDSTWGAPRNLGPDINTSGNEDAGYLMPDGKTLYFDSNGHGGYGNHDVFVSYRLDSTWQKWSKPENLGRPINTPGYDFDFFFAPNLEYAYWGSDIKSYGSNDIYRIRLKDPELTLYPERRDNKHTICEGDTLWLESGFALAKSLSYQWWKDGQVLPEGGQRRLAVTEAGMYRLSRTLNGTEETSEIVTVEVLPAPDVTMNITGDVLCDDKAIVLWASKVPDVTYFWQRNGLDIPQESKHRYSVERPGTYQVKVFNGKCYGFSKKIEVIELENPPIYVGEDKESEVLAELPSSWQWVTDTEQEGANLFLKDMAVSPQGNSYISGVIEKGKNSLWRFVGGYDVHGKKKFWRELSINAQSKADHFVTSDNEGNLYLTTNERYLTKYNPNGDIEWSKSIEMEKVTGIAVDAAGTLYTTGRFKDTLELETVTVPPTKRSAMYLAKHDPWGNIQWVQRISLDWVKRDFGNNVHVDCEGYIYVAAEFYKVANFRGKVLYQSELGRDFFIAKYSPAGKLEWAKKINTNKAEYVTSDVHTDCEGNTYLTVDYMLFKYNKHGQKVWEETLRAPGNPIIARLTSDDTGNIYVTGVTDIDQHFVLRFDAMGHPQGIWRGYNGQKDVEHFPLIGTDQDGNVYTSGIHKGKAEMGKFTLENKEVFIAQYGKSNQGGSLAPAMLKEGESTVLRTIDREGLIYQWMNNGVPIEGATSARYVANTPGNYSVSVKANECDKMSGIQELIEEEPLETDIKYGGDGEVKKLNNRKVVTQEEVNVSNPLVTISVWDHAAADRDTISLNVNGKWLLTHHGLVKKQQKLTVKLRKGNNYIVLYAHNLGVIPPNTASIMVDDGKKTHTLKLKSNMGSCGALNVKLE